MYLARLPIALQVPHPGNALPRSQSRVDVTFWGQLGAHKLHSLKLDEGPVPLEAAWTASNHAEQPGLLTVTDTSLPPRPASGSGSGEASAASAAATDASTLLPGRCYAASGELWVLNTAERLLQFDRKAAVQRAAERDKLGRGG